MGEDVTSIAEAGPDPQQSGEQQLDIHRPKPIHGWREFAKEVGIIVLGVLIALAGEQLVETYREREMAASAAEAINGELIASAANAAMRIALDDCIRGRIAQLSARLAATGDQWSADPMPFAVHLPGMPVLPMAYSVPRTPHVTSAWDMAVANGLSRYMPRTRSEDYADLYLNITALNGYQQKEESLAAELQPLAQTRRLDTRSAYEAARALGSLDDLNSSVVFASHVILAQIKRLGIDIPRAEETLKPAMKVQKQLRGACVKPIVME
ncbi:hypothetical protein BH09PSE4_BH09PSE4_10700 [soil metagenome]